MIKEIENPIAELKIDGCLHYKMILDTSMGDYQIIFEHMDEGFEKILGENADELVGINIDEVIMKQRNEHSELIQRMLQYHESKNFEYYSYSSSAWYRMCIHQYSKEKFILTAFSLPENPIFINRDRIIFDIIDELDYGVAVYDEDLRLIKWNQAMIRETGISAEAVIGKKVDDELKDLWLGSYRKALHRLLEGKVSSITDVYKFQNFNTGKLRWYEGTHNLIKDGEHTYIIDAARDVTDEIEVTKTHINILKNAIDQSPFAIAITDLDGKLEYVNKHYCHMTGYTTEEVVGNTPNFNILDMNSPDLLEDLWRTIRAGEVWKGKPITIRKNGEPLYERTTVAPLLDEEGRCIRYVAYLEDISDLIALEQMLHETNIALIEANEELKQKKERLVEAQSMALLGRWHIDIKTGRIIWPKIIRQIYQIEPDVEVTYDLIAKLTHPDDIERVDKAFEYLHNAQKSFDITHRLKFENGTEKWVHVKMRPEFDDSGNMIHANGIIQDITQLKIVEEKLKFEVKRANNLKKLAERSNDYKSRFLANMSHEIRTPLNAISGYMQLLEKTDLAPKQINYINKINSSVDLLLSIINDILDYAKIEAGMMSIEDDEFNLNKLIESVSEQIAVKAMEKRLKLMLTHSSDVEATLRGDSLRLRQILINLLNNAIKFTESGSITLKVENIGQTMDKVKLKFSVIDTGIGIAKDDMKKLFNPFEQIENSSTRKYGGSGLGLVITKELVEMMGGDMGVESEVGEGSSFYFELPFKRVFQYDVNTLDDKKISELNVLVVDDSEDDRRHLQKTLESLGIDVTLANSGEEAIYILQKMKNAIKFDFIVIDLRMPGLSGFQTAKAIEKLYGNNDIPDIIFVTAYSQERKIQVDEDATYLVLSKPVSSTMMRESILEIIAKNHLNPNKNEITSDKIFEGISILAVDDNEINMELLEELLKDYGAEVFSARNGIKAIEILENHDCDIILMDVQMPIMDGYEASKKIKDNPRTAEIPIIAMTANAMNGEREHCLNAGMNDYLSKPINFNVLQDTVTKWLKRRKKGLITIESHYKKNNTNYTMPDLIGIDKAIALEHLDGNEELLSHLLIKFHQNHHNVVNELRVFMDEEDYSGARKLIHSLKGIVGTLGAIDAYDSSLTLETLLKNEEIPEIKEAILEFNTTFDILFASIGYLMETIKIDTNSLLNVDIDLMNVLDSLEKHLYNFDMNAVKYVDALDMLKNHPSCSRRIKHLSKAIQEYEFEKALNLIKGIRNKL